MGMLMDRERIPLAFCINPGNTNEQVTLKPLEQKLNDNFGISKLVVCTDCGLSSYENRKNNDVGEWAFITVQSLKKLKKHAYRITCFMTQSISKKLSKLTISTLGKV